MKRTLLAALLLACAGCSATKETWKAKDFDPRVPLRVAVLPFQDVSSGDPWYSVPLAKAIDLAPILSDDRMTKEHAASIYREKIQGNLHRTHLDLINLHVVDSLLAHRKVEPETIYAAKETERTALARKLGRLLGVDAVMFGTVVEWNREYFLVESVVHAGLRVELRDTTTGGVLFRSEVRELEASGISKLPIVYSPDGAASAIFGQSIKGLQNTLFVTLSDNVARTLVEELTGGAEARAGAKAPEIRFVAHSANAPLRPGQELVVVARGDKGCRATFRLGHGPAYPLTESAPGTYQGRLRISRAHALKGEPLTVKLVNDKLRGSTMTIAKPAITAAR